MLENVFLIFDDDDPSKWINKHFRLNLQSVINTWRPRPMPTSAKKFHFLSATLLYSHGGDQLLLATGAKNFRLYRRRRQGPLSSCMAERRAVLPYFTLSFRFRALWSLLRGYIMVFIAYSLSVSLRPLPVVAPPPGFHASGSLVLLLEAQKGDIRLFCSVLLGTAWIRPFKSCINFIWHVNRTIVYRYYQIS